MAWGSVFLILSGFFFSAVVEAEPICASTYAELDRSMRLQTLKTILADGHKNGFVNKTQGSYFFLETGSSHFIMTFYTTGLFDLYGIKREGKIEFCEENDQIFAIGLERKQKIFIEASRLEFGDRRDKESFIRGPMPKELARIHKIDQLVLASF